MSVFPETLSQDQGRLHRLQAAAKRNAADDAATLRFAEALSGSQSAYAARAAGVPEARVDETLPVGQYADQLRQLIAKYPVVVVAGETGSGKTTQIPKICLTAGRGIAGMIGCTQPRRIAARAVANRVAEELQTAVGGAVGFQVRFNERVGERTYLKFMTDGILLAEIQSDPWLSRYDTLIIDEAHERSLNIDFLLGYLKTLVGRRHDLKIIITSATIDTARFAAHFADAPVLEVEGRSHPVEVRYREFQEDATGPGAGRPGRERAEDLTLPEKITLTVDEITAQDGLGDILVFLPGEREIRETHLALSRRKYRATEVLPLYARLSAKDQDRVFHPDRGRRIVLATNVAETSLTVPRIRYVIDPGLARVKRYSPRQKMDRLQIEPVSQASANQRKGRCGRISAGICYRLYSELDFNQRPEFTDPEIRRASLAGVILRMLHLRLGALEKFPFIDMPDARAINDGWQNLTELGAIDGQRQLTAIGRQMARLPVDVKLARMLVAANAHEVLHEMTVIAAFMGIPDPRERPADAKEAADNAHRIFQDTTSEFLGVINLWRAYRKAHEDLSQSHLRKWCERHFLSYLRMREWRELHRQLLISCQELQWPLTAWDDIESKLTVQSSDAKAAAQHYRMIHRALLSGLPTQIGHRNDKGSFDAPRQRRFNVFPASPLAKQPPSWCLVGNLLDTQKVWGLMAARIEPDWLVEECPHLLTRTYHDPHWSRRQGRVVGHCQISLLGLLLVAKKPVHYGSLFPEEARGIFIRQALLTGEINTRSGFVSRNLQTLAKAHDEEAKQRRSGLVVDEDWQARWYLDRIPPEINSSETLDKWFRALPEAKKQSLLWQHGDLMLAEQSGVALFPEFFVLGNNRLALHYAFAPGEAEDGVTLDVPIHLLNALDDGRLSWLVPGLVEEKATALIRGLPKALRRNYVPAPDFARAFFQAYPAGDADALEGALARFLTRTTGAPLTALDFKEVVLEAYLRINLRLADRQGQILAQSRDLDALKNRFSALAEQAFSAQAGQDFGDEALAAFPDRTIPSELATAEGLTAFPALVLEDGAVFLRAVAVRSEAERLHSEAVRHLLLESLRDQRKSAAKQLPVDPRLGLLYATLESAERMRADCVQAACNALLQDDYAGIRSRADFDAVAKKLGAELFGQSMTVLTLLQDCMATTARIRAQLKPELMGWASGNLADIKAHLDRLVFPGFLAAHPAALLKQLPRYLKALHLRVERALLDPVKDQSRLLDAKPFNEAVVRMTRSAMDTPEAQRFRQDVEELNVQIFAQELALKGAVSRKHLVRQMSAIT
ncbi:ATP-dependent RNA helicase HrpA [Arenimonas sp.]|jgi:ATP-dependent helicase HrpA|uniref:ATP-dependent RNA helicase HrpA n=1 Tax=Arenimonas sp. TaxID=1872635 RepID=UPI0037C099EC